MKFPIKVGDEILVRMTVREKSPSYLPTSWWCKFGNIPQYYHVSEEYIYGHIPAPLKPFEVGDKVIMKDTNGNMIYIIEAIKDSHIWCKYLKYNYISEEYSYTTRMKEDLEYA